LPYGIDETSSEEDSDMDEFEAESEAEAETAEWILPLRNQ